MKENCFDVVKNLADSGNPKAQSVLGTLYEFMNKQEKAKKQYKKCIKNPIATTLQKELAKNYWKNIN